MLSSSFSFFSYIVKGAESQTILREATQNYGRSAPWCDTLDCTMFQRYTGNGKYRDKIKVMP